MDEFCKKLSKSGYLLFSEKKYIEKISEIKNKTKSPSFLYCLLNVILELHACLD